MDLHAYDVPEADRATFVQLMAEVARADGSLSDEERVALESAMTAWQLSDADRREVEEVMAQGADIATLAARFSQPRTRYLLVQELVTLASLDGSYDTLERHAVRMIAAAAGVSDTRLAAIEDWVEAGIAWRQLGITLLEPED